MVISSLQVAMIVPVKYGRLKQAIYFILSKVIKMQCILWLSMFHSGNTSIISRDRIATGSFDKTAKLWDTNTGACLHTFAGHQN